MTTTAGGGGTRRGGAVIRRAESSTGSAIRALIGLAPKTARLVRADGREEEVALESVRVLIFRRQFVRGSERRELEGRRKLAMIPDKNSFWR